MHFKLNLLRLHYLNVSHDYQLSLYLYLKEIDDCLKNLFSCTFCSLLAFALISLSVFPVSLSAFLLGFSV